MVELYFWKNTFHFLAKDCLILILCVSFYSLKKKFRIEAQGL